MEREVLFALGIVALAFLFMLPQWSPVMPYLNITSASLTNTSVSFSIKYAAPWPKSCFIVVYGPFIFDRPGHEEGNNIYVLDKRIGEIKDTLLLRKNARLEKLRAELWCDWKKMKEAEFSFE